MPTLQYNGIWPFVQGQEIEGPGEGFLCMKAAWPSSIRTIYGDQDRFETTYFAPFKVHPSILENPNLLKINFGFEHFLLRFCWYMGCEITQTNSGSMFYYAPLAQ